MVQVHHSWTACCWQPSRDVTYGSTAATIRLRYAYDYGDFQSLCGVFCRMTYVFGPKACDWTYVFGSKPVSSQQGDDAL